MIFGIEFRDEHDKQELVEKAQAAKEAVCDLWDKMAEHMPELQQIQERNARYRNGMMANPGGWNGGFVGYRNYGGGSNYRGGYGMAGGPSMGGYGMYRENPAYTGYGDRPGY